MGNNAVAKIEFTQAEIDKAKAKLLQLMDAKVVVRSPKRDDLGRIVYEEVDDHGIQLAATRTALEFAVGKPKQMMEVQTGPNAAGRAMSQADLARLLAKNPELTATVIKTLQEGLKNAQAIDVTPDKPGSEASPSDSESGASPS